MVRYRVMPEHAERNAELVRAVYDELGRRRPDGLRYVTFVADDGVTFVHVASTETDAGGNPLTELEAFRRFQEGVRDRCVEPPVATELTPVGSYRFLGGAAEV